MGILSNPLILIYVVFSFNTTDDLCRCNEPRSIPDAYAYFDLIVWGEVVHQAKNLDAYATEVEMEVQGVYKGEHIEEQLTIYTPASGAACGSHFSIGERYQVYLIVTDNEEETGPFRKFPKKVYATHNCTRTKEFREFEHKELLKVANQFR